MTALWFWCLPSVLATPSYAHYLQCVNELDTEAPPPFEYTPLRRCGPGVELGHTKDFLLSCSCDGGHCAKEGCPCNKLSVEEAQRTRTHDLMHPLHVADVGYTHRRLLTERTAAYVHKTRTFLHAGPVGKGLLFCGLLAVRCGIHVTYEYSLSASSDVAVDECPQVALHV